MPAQRGVRIITLLQRHVTAATFHCMSDARTIGVFDSGICGLTVVKALHALDAGVRVRSRACPLLVPLIEEGLLDDEVSDHMIARYLEPMVTDGIDTLVLGCTHYPLLADAIARFLGEKIALVDSARNCASAVQQLLDRQALRAHARNSGGLEVALTDAADNFLTVARDALRLEI